MSKLLITSGIIVMLMITIIGIGVIISLQDEDGPSVVDKDPPVIHIISPEPDTVFSPGDNISIIIDLGEDNKAVPFILGKLTDEEYENDLVQFCFNYTHPHKWTAVITIPEDTTIGDWFIFIEAMDKARNVGSREIQISIQ